MKRTIPQQHYVCANRCRTQRKNTALWVVYPVRAIRFVLSVLIVILCSSTSLFAQSNTYFRTEVGVPYIPVLSAAPSSPTVGSVYVNSTDKVVYKYEGSQWVPVGASVFAKSVLSSASVLYKGQIVTPDIQYIYSGGLIPATCAVSGGMYAWYRATDAAGTDKAVIASGTGTPASYTVVAGDVGKYLGLGVTPATACNAPALESVSWKLVSALTPVVSSVTISGISGGYALKGATLTASFSGYSCAPVQIPTDAGAACTYQWYYANNVAGTGKAMIAGKKSATYTVSFSDGYTAGKYIAVGVTPVATNGDAGSETISTWYPTTALVPAYSLASIVGLTEGKAQNNTTLAAVTGIYSAAPLTVGTEGTPTYKWYYATDAAGTSKTVITGQTARTHTVNIGLGYGYTSDAYYLAVGVTPFTITGEIGSEVLSSWVKIQVIRAADGTLVNELKSPSGRVWMDRNLGASRAATSSTDYLAYGSNFQWCRAADGHEKITWTSATAGTSVNGSTTMLSATSTPGHSLFVLNPNSPYDWLTTPQTDGSLWWNGTTSGANNPCPIGYHVPTYTEWNVELVQGITNAATAYSQLKLPMAGYRYSFDASFIDTGNYGYYWSNSISGYRSSFLYFINGGGAGINNAGGRGAALSVRCIKN